MGRKNSFCKVLTQSQFSSVYFILQISENKNTNNVRSKYVCKNRTPQKLTRANEEGPRYHTTSYESYCFTQTSANISAKGHYLAEISSFDLHWTVHVSRWVTRGCTRTRKLILQGIYHRIMGRPGTCHPTICSFVEFLYLADLVPSVRTHSSTMRAASPVSTSRIWWTAASRLSSATRSRQVRARRLSSSALPLARLNAACVWGLAGWRIVGNINESSHVRLLNSFRWQTAALGCSSVHPRPPSTPPLPPTSLQTNATHLTSVSKICTVEPCRSDASGAIY